MDEGDGTNGFGSGVSRYTEILMDTIKDYVASNPDVDENRIYLGGYSNGGYMTMNMIINYPDYFAAAYPVCEAYAYHEFVKNEDGTYKLISDENNRSVPVMSDSLWFTDQKIDAIKDVPIWFVQSIDDPIVDPKIYAMPTYQVLVQAGAKNAWFSMYETVVGTDSPGAAYIGHFSWIYLFNNQVEGVQEPQNIINAVSDSNYSFVASNETNGVASKAVVDGIEYNNIFQWLNVQSK